MTDPLSVIASATALVTAGTICTKKLLTIIKSIRHAPEELMALSNEVTHLTATINLSRTVCEALARNDSSTGEFIETLESLLKSAEVMLGDLSGLVSRLTSKRGKIDKTTSMLYHKPRVKEYLLGLQNTRMKISELLALKPIQLMLDLRMQVQALDSSYKQILQHIGSTPPAIAEQLLPQQDSLQIIVSSGPVISLEEQNLPLHIVHGNSENEVTSPPSTLGNQSLQDQGAAVVTSELVTEPVSHTAALTGSFSKSVICFNMYKHSNCDGICDCSCHPNYRYRTPLMLRNLIGTLFLRSNRASLLGPNCDKSSCQNHASRSLQLTYCFPKWLLERALHVVAVMTHIGTPVFGLEVRRKIGWGGKDSILRFALTGNTLGAKSMLESGKASIADEDPNHGRTALYYAVQYHRVETCEFLLNAGSDPCAEDLYGISTSQKAWEQIFAKNGTTESLEAFPRLFPKSAVSETWEFSQLHEVVLSLLPTSLEGTLQNQKYREQVNIRDYKGRTPLHWAATRGDIPAVGLLLGNGADVNIQDEANATPLILAASSGSVRTLELLLLAGANVRLTDIRGGHALHYVCRHQRDIAPVKLLLQAGTPVNCRNIYGHTPFTGAAITNRYEIGMLLLQQGADMHNCSDNNETPLFETIFHNSHEFLRWLLQAGAKHGHINKAGSTILHAAAHEADLETIEILAASKPGGLDTDLLDKNGKTALEISRQRIAPPSGFQEAFEQFLRIVQERSSPVLL